MQKSRPESDEATDNLQRGAALISKTCNGNVAPRRPASRPLPPTMPHCPSIANLGGSEFNLIKCPNESLSLEHGSRRLDKNTLPISSKTHGHTQLSQEMMNI